MFDGHWRKVVDVGVKPIGNGLARLGVTPDQLTVVGLVMSVATAVAIGSGHTMLGFWILLLSAFPDLFDGAVAKASQSSSVRGAFFDSTADRITDGFLLGGIAWHLYDDPGGRAPMLAYAVLGVSTLISYMRAKAEIYGYDAKGGVMERAERIIAMCVGLFFNILIPVLWIMLVLTPVTAIQRFVKVWRQAEKPPTPIAPAPVIRVRARANGRSRWTERRAVENRLSARPVRGAWKQRRSQAGSSAERRSLSEVLQERRQQRSRPRR